MKKYKVCFWIPVRRAWVSFVSWVAPAESPVIRKVLMGRDVIYR